MPYDYVVPFSFRLNMGSPWKYAEEFTSADVWAARSKGVVDKRRGLDTIILR